MAAGERICGYLDDRRHCVAKGRVVERRLHDIARLLQIIEDRIHRPTIGRATLVRMPRRRRLRPPSVARFARLGAGFSDGARSAVRGEAEPGPAAGGAFALCLLNHKSSIWKHPTQRVFRERGPRRNRRCASFLCLASASRSRRIAGTKSRRSTRSGPPVAGTTRCTSFALADGMADLANVSGLRDYAASVTAVPMSRWRSRAAPPLAALAGGRHSLIGGGLLDRSGGAASRDRSRQI